VFILALVVMATGGSLLLYAARAPALAPSGLFAPVSREGALVLNNLLLASAAATVLLGTFYPLFLDVIGGAKVSVGAPYFNITFTPLMTPLLIVVVIGPCLAWKRADLLGALQRLWLAGGAALLVALITWYVHSGGPVLAVFGMGLAAWLVIGAFAELADRIKLFEASWTGAWQRARRVPRAAYGTAFAHAGLGISLAGIICMTAWKVEHVQMMHAGETVDLAGYSVRLEGVVPHDGPNYEGQRATITVSRDGRQVATMFPEKRHFPVAGQDTTETAIRTWGIADIYAVLGDGDGKGGWTVRLYYNPLAPFIWFGAVVMVFGGLISLSDRRYRVGAPARRRLPSGAAAAITN
jgi:cytochrome c-type biogenesis protein CcmF